MLAEVAGSSLEPSHISTPLRTSLRRTQVIRGRVSEVDLEGRRIQVAVEGGGVRELVYDQVVFALGAVSNYLGLKNVQELAFDFKSLLDAIRIRNHVIDMFEQADRETDPELRRERLTFVIAGGGFAGVELAGALNDFSRGILADYPNISIRGFADRSGSLARPHLAGTERIAGTVCAREHGDAWRHVPAQLPPERLRARQQ